MIEAVKGRRSEALGELYDRHSALLLAVALRILGDLEAAEEVLTTTFFEVWCRPGGYDARRSTVWAWLVLLVRREALSRHRGHEVPSQSGAMAPTAGRVAGHLGAGSERAVGSRRRQRVLDALQLLPRLQRRALDLAFYGGLTAKDVADREKVSLGAVQTGLVESLRALRAILVEGRQGRSCKN